MTQAEIVTYVTINVVLFLILIAAVFIYKLDYFHVVDQARIEKECEKADKMYAEDVKRFGSKFMED